jgi:DinB superfamily
LTDPVSALAASRRALARLPDVLDALAGDLDPAIARTRPARDEWAPVEILCHLRDEEAEDFGARLRAVVNGEASFKPIDPVSWVEARRYRDADAREVLEALRIRRRASIQYLEGIDAARLAAAIPLGKLGPLSGLDLLVAWVAHDQLHLAQLAATLARLWANRWPEQKAEYAGPIPYPVSGSKAGPATG